MKYNSLKLLSSILIVIIIILLSVGYSAYTNKLEIDGISAHIGMDADIRVTALNIDSLNNATENSSNYGVDYLLTDFTFNSSDSSITYKVNITNFGNVKMGILNISGLPDELDYEIDNYNMHDAICDTENKCINGITKEIILKIKVKEGQILSTSKNYSLQLSFDFRLMSQINYISIDNSNTYPSEIIEGSTLTINLNVKQDSLKIYMNGLLLTENINYTYINNQLVISNVEGVINIINKKDLLTDEYVEQTINFGGLTLTSYGNGEFSLNGTYNGYSTYYVRLNGTLYAAKNKNDLNKESIVGVPTNVIIEAPATVTLEVEESGTSNINSSDFFRLVFRGTKIMNEISGAAYDFYTHEVSGSGIFTDSIGIFSLYFNKLGKGMSFDNFHFKIKVYSEPLESNTITLSGENNATITMFASGIVKINTNGEALKNSYYVRLEYGAASAVNNIDNLDFERYRYYPLYKTNETLIVSYSPLENIPTSYNEVSILYGNNKAVQTTDSSGNKYNENKVFEVPESKMSTLDLSSSSTKEFKLTTNASFKILYLEEGSTFDNFTFATTTTKK